MQNALIDKYNDFLLEIAKEKHIFYLDISEVLKGSDGQVKSEYNGGDGLHYSGKGCEAIFNYIVEHPVPGISDDGEYVVKYVKPDPNKVKVTTGDESGINEGNFGDLMDIMGITEDQNASDASSQSSTVTEDEEEKKQEEEENKAEEEKNKQEEEQNKAEEENNQKEDQNKAEEEKNNQEEQNNTEEEPSNSGSTENNEENGDNGSGDGNEAPTSQSEGSSGQTTEDNGD